MKKNLQMTDYLLKSCIRAKKNSRKKISSALKKNRIPTVHYYCSSVIGLRDDRLVKYFDCIIHRKTAIFRRCLFVKKILLALHDFVTFLKLILVVVEDLVVMVVGRNKEVCLVE